MAARFVTVPKFCELTGYTAAAVSGKRSSGVWLEGVVWRKAPDGHILIDLVEFDRWVIGAQSLPHQRAA